MPESTHELYAEFDAECRDGGHGMITRRYEVTPFFGPEFGDVSVVGIFDRLIGDWIASYELTEETDS